MCLGGGLTGALTCKHTHFSIDLLLLHLLFIMMNDMSMTHVCILLCCLQNKVMLQPQTVMWHDTHSACFILCLLSNQLTNHDCASWLNSKPLTSDRDVPKSEQ